MGRQSDIARYEVVKEYGIKFRPYLATERWPETLQNLIKSVQKLVKISYDEWREDVHLDKNRPWRTEIQKRARTLHQLGLQAEEDCRQLNETDWRMRLEPEVFKRFDTEVTCQICTGRLWRSEVEIDASSAGLLDRQKNRTACHCAPGENESGLVLNRIFGSLTDTMIKYDAILLEKLGKKFEKPDRIYGLRRVGRIERYMFRKDPRRDSGGRTLQMQLRSSLIANDSICLFPFLVFEAKAAYGAPQASIDSQTAFIVRESLLLQKDVQNASESSKKEPSPCVWCVSQRGAVWEISLAYLTQKQEEGDVNEYGVNVVRLWSGDVSTLDAALRLLLVIDFIFDWARDEYREKVIRQLYNLVSESNGPRTAMAFPQTPEPTVISMAETVKDHYVEAFKDHASLVSSTASQVDVLLDKRKTENLVRATQNLRLDRLDEIESWNLDVLNDQMARRFDAEAPTNFDTLRKYDSEDCVFRDATFIRSRVMGLFITEETVDLLFHSKSEDKLSINLLRHIITKLEREDLLVLPGDAITAMEQAWAGYNKNQPEIKDPSEKFFVLLTFSAYLDSDWEQIRELNYLAVSTKAIKALCQLGNRAVRFYWVRCDLELVMSLVEVFLRASISANLAACLYRVSMTPYFVNGQHDDNIFRDNSNLRPCVMLSTQKQRARDLIWDIYRGNRVGRLEPSAPFLRVSSRLDKQSPLVTASTSRKTGAPWTTLNIADPLVLSYSKNPTTLQGPEWSLFLVKGDESRNVILSLALGDAQLRRAYNTYRLGREPGWERVCWNNTAIFDERAGIPSMAKRFAKHLASALFNDTFKSTAESSHDGHSLVSGQSSYYDDESILSQASSGYESDSTLQEGHSFVGCGDA